MSLEDADPRAAEQRLEPLMLGVDRNDNEIRYGSIPWILTLIFPHLFTEGMGYYILVPRKASEEYDDEEEQSLHLNPMMTIVQYVISNVIKTRKVTRLNNVLILLKL
jgi:hypothetical protein